MTSLLLLKSMLLANAFHNSKKKRKRNNNAVKLKNSSKKVHKSSGNMCRICNKEKGDIPIFNNFIQPNIPEEIKNFSGVMVNINDDLPKHICQNCLNLLNGCIMFREMCQKTNKLMIELSIKKEAIQESKVDCGNYNKCIENEQHEESESSYNVPSPSFTEDYSEISCTFCDKEFFDVAEFNKHRCNTTQLTEEDNEKKNLDVKKNKFLCDVCGKISSSNANLLAHMTTHENIFPYECDICPYRGRTIDLLKVHKRTHLAEKPYKCSQCPKATTSASNLQKHMRHVHSSNRPYKCNYCEKGFSFQHDMKRHVRDIHLRQGTVECDICFKKFNTKKILRGHQYKVHKVKGDRQGRLPAYLQCQLDVQSDFVNDEEYAPSHEDSTA